MPWIKDFTEYRYTKRLLRIIAENYPSLYSGLPLTHFITVMNPFSLAEYKADFDQALNAIGYGHWTGITGITMHDYRRFGKLQQAVIAEILGIPYDLRVQSFAYYLMAEFLNTGVNLGVINQG